MKKIIIFTLILASLVYSCRPKKSISVGSGVNTSRSNIKNNMDVKDTSKVITPEKK